MSPQVEIDLFGDALSQSAIDLVIARAASEKGGMVDIVIRNVATKCLPRLIVDYGDVFPLLVDEIRRLRDERAAG